MGVLKVDTVRISVIRLEKSWEESVKKGHRLTNWEEETSESVK